MTDNGIKESVKKKLHAIADKIDWVHLTISERKQYYEAWTKDPEIGGALSSILEPSQVRVYLKDTIMRSYSENQRIGLQDLIISLNISCSEVIRRYEKPETILCADNQLFTLVIAKDWKTAIMNAFERGQEIKRLSTNEVFVIDHTTGRFVDKSYRQLIEDAAKRLNIKVHWIT
jgi:hypothetical protein